MSNEERQRHISRLQGMIAVSGLPEYREALNAAISALEREQDGLRYRYLRAKLHFSGPVQYRLEWYLPRSFKFDSSLREELDQALDAAILRDKFNE